MWSATFTRISLDFAVSSSSLCARCCDFAGSAIGSWINKKRFSSLRGAEKFPPMFNGLRRWMDEFDDARVFANVGYTKWARCYDE